MAKKKKRKKRPLVPLYANCRTLAIKVEPLLSDRFTEMCEVRGESKTKLLTAYIKKSVQAHNRKIKQGLYPAWTGEVKG